MSAWRRGRAYSQDLRDRVLSADGVGSGQVAGRFGVSASYVVKARQRRDRLGEVTPGAQRSHTPPKLAGYDDAITARVMRQPDMTLDELRAWILVELGISVSMSTVWKTLRRLKLTLKKSRLWRLNRALLHGSPQEMRHRIPLRLQAMRTKIGRPSFDMRFKTWTATRISVPRRSSVWKRNPSPIICLYRPIVVSTRLRFV